VSEARRSITEPQKMERVLDAARQCLDLDGEFWECGVFMGGSAKELADLCRPTGRVLRLFDSFKGLPKPSPVDVGKEVIEGWFNNNEVGPTIGYVGYDKAVWHVGVIPQTFVALEDAVIAFAYLDLDMYQGTLDALKFVWPRLALGGQIVIDDYGHSEWPGVEIATKEFFYSIRGQAAWRAFIAYPDGQAVVKK